jgi:hypothetical protein
MKKMRKEFVETDSRYRAKNEASWAAKIVRVCGGFLAFESINDYYSWKNQK